MARILVVEDDGDIARLVSMILRREGHEVFAASNGRDAVTLAMVRLPDLVIMDLTLPVVDGWSATWQLKRHERTARIPVLALTAHLWPDALAHEPMPFAGVLLKPFDLRDLTVGVAGLVPPVSAA